MEQVLGDFFLELNNTAMNYGWLAIAPFLIGVGLNLTEVFFHGSEPSDLTGLIEKNKKDISLLRSQVYAMNGEYAAFFMPGRILTEEDKTVKDGILQQCNYLSEQLAGFQQAQYQLLTSAEAEQTAKVTRQKTILKVTTISFIVTAGLWLLKSAVKVFDPIKA